jgi:hypothetical protein
MTVKELIEKLEQIQNKDLEVRIIPDSELVIEDRVSCYGFVGDIEEKIVYLDEDDAFLHGGFYKNFDDLIESSILRLEEYFECDVDDIPKSDLEAWANEKEKLHALVIRAKP